MGVLTILAARGCVAVVIVLLARHVLEGNLRAGHVMVLWRIALAAFLLPLTEEQVSLVPELMNMEIVIAHTLTQAFHSSGYSFQIGMRLLICV